MRHQDPAPHRPPVDAVGIAIMIAWIGAAQFVLDRGLDMDWFGSNVIVGSTILAVIGFVAFLIWELTEANPVVNLRIFRNRTFAAGCLTMFFLSSVFYGSLLISPLWLQTNMGYTAALAGVVAAPMGVVMFVLTPIVAQYVHRTDPRYLMTVGLLSMSVVYFWRGHFASNVTVEMVVLANFALGLAASFTFPSAMTYTMSKLKPDEVAAGSGLIGFIRTIGIAFSASLITTQWHDAAILNRAGMVERLDAAHGRIPTAEIGMPAGQGLGLLDRIVQDQAVMLATNDIYVALAAIVAGVALVIWIVSPRATRIAP
jgi:DHA2 family multidrug resistance protein